MSPMIAHTFAQLQHQEYESHMPRCQSAPAQKKNSLHGKSQQSLGLGSITALMQQIEEQLIGLFGERQIAEAK